MTPNAPTTKIAPPLAPADVDRLADEIAEVASHIDAAEHRLLTPIRRFDEGSGWAAHGALCCAHWLDWRIGLDLGAARERVRVARALGGLPLVGCGRRRRRSSSRRSTWRAGPRATTSTRTRTSPQPPSRAPTRWSPSRRRASRRPTSAGATHDTAGAPIELVVHVDHTALRADPHAHTEAADADAGHDPTAAHATLDDGTPISLATAQRLACDATVVLVTDTQDIHHDTHDKTHLPSRRTRRISTPLRRALRLRDDGCRFPGCTNRLTDAHHVLAWARGGTTRLANLCSLCRRHHRLVHEHGYRIETSTHGELRFFRRDGSPVPLADEQRRIARTSASANDALGALRDTHAALGIAIDSTTACPHWDGEPVDYGLVVQALLIRGSNRVANDRVATSPA